jgi:hypothetical protein
MQRSNHRGKILEMPLSNGAVTHDSARTFPNLAIRGIITARLCRSPCIAGGGGFDFKEAYA